MRVRSIFTQLPCSQRLIPLLLLESCPRNIYLSTVCLFDEELCLLLLLNGGDDLSANAARRNTVDGLCKGGGGGWQQGMHFRAINFNKTPIVCPSAS